MSRPQRSFSGRKDDLLLVHLLPMRGVRAFAAPHQRNRSPIKDLV